MVRILLPAHLRTLARVDGEVRLHIEGSVTQRAVLDALEACLSDVARDDPRPCDETAPTVCPLLRLRAGSLPWVARRTSAGCGRDRS